jgi:predicted PurR-regulated permease PerM
LRIPFDGNDVGVAETARKTFVATVVAGSLVVLALALWKLKILLALVFLAFIIAAAIRPAIDGLARRRVPRGAAILLLYAVFAAAIALALWVAVPRALHQVDRALGGKTTTELTKQANASEGFKHDILVAIRNRLQEVPETSELVRPAAEVGMKAFEAIIGVFFVFAAAAYWIFERDRAEDLVCSLLPRPKRKVVRDTWNLIDLKLGAFVRGQSLLIALVAAVLSLLFWIIGLPYWLLVACFAGVVEIVPVIGPLAAGALAVTVGLTESLHVAALAAVCVLVVRLLEDYIVIPKVLGDAVGLSPLLVLFSVSAAAILLGGWAVLFAVPIAAVVVTLFDVIARDRDPAEEEVPTVLFPAKESEG